MAGYGRTPTSQRLFLLLSKGSKTKGARKFSRSLLYYYYTSNPEVIIMGIFSLMSGHPAVSRHYLQCIPTKTRRKKDQEMWKKKKKKKKLAMEETPLTPIESCCC